MEIQKTGQTQLGKGSIPSFDAALQGKWAGRKNMCLLLDVSGSMLGYTDRAQVTKIEALRTVASNFSDVPRIVFDDRVKILDSNESIPRPGGSTALHLGIDAVDSEGYTGAVLITDGMPDDERRALDAARRTGIKLDIIYVGPPPEPPFLSDLAKACGGTFSAGDLSYTEEIEGKITALLAAGTASDEEKGPIVL